MRTLLPLTLCFTLGVVMLAQWFVPHSLSMEFFRRVNDWILTISVFAIVLGVGSLLSLHLRRIRRRSENWQYSIVVIVGLFGMATVGLVEGCLHPQRKLEKTEIRLYPEGSFTVNENTLTLREKTAQGLLLDKGDRIRLFRPDGSFAESTVAALAADRDDGNTDGVITVTVNAWREGIPPQEGNSFAIVQPGADVFNWLYQYLYIPLDATMFSLLAFFIASAAFRAFRARNLEATLLLVAACIVILGLTSPFVYLWRQVVPGAPELPTKTMQWILEVPNLAMRRAILLGVGLGAVAQAFRIIFGIERSYLGGRQ